MPTEKELLEREIAKLSGKSRSPFPPIFQTSFEESIGRLNDMNAVCRCDRG